MTRIFLARHAEPEKGPGVSRANGPLSRFGRNQADYLADRLLEYRPLKIVSSPTRRCKETAEIAAERLGVRVTFDPRLGELEAPRGVDVNVWFKQYFHINANASWGQLGADVVKWRADNVKAIGELKENTAVFTQFLNINAIMSAALKLDNTAVCRPDYASLTEFSVVNGDVRLVMDGTEIKGPNE